MSEKRISSRRMGMLLLPALFAVAGCAMGPDFVRPKPVLPDHWQNTVATAAPQASTAPWWGIFNDPVLDSLMRRAETENLDMSLARERIRAARIQRRAASAESLPSLNGQASYTHERIGTAGVGQVLQPLLGLSPEAGLHAPEGVSYTNYSIGAVASWELDLWGRQRRLQEAAKAEFSAVQADMDAMHLSTQAELARTYFQWLWVSDRLNRAEKKLERAEKLLTIAQQVHGRGLLANVDLEKPQSFYQAALDEKEELVAQQASLHRALAVLAAGRPDAEILELAKPENLLDVKIPDVAVGIPSDMARKRPDIRAAEARLHAATATIGMAQADFYPQITLTGQISLDALTVAELGWNARNTSFGPTLSLPIFNGGRLSRQLELRHSEQRSAGMFYKSVVLNAWVEIENLLSRENVFRSQYQRQRSLLDSEKTRIAVLQKRYQQGDMSQAELLRASLPENESAENLARTHAELLTNSVDLKAAMGN
ncbi:RND efflux system, outer membrane lipoprotein, NodT family [Acetobacter malorum]|uniref:RND efflux system, outer membrane lipoprotein, NodT family n=1 Tax=Acetobacter malorum TaxID=178901 RepID=A0A177G610_9PROT|nr:efflux transporter outer membrane subunit [Acetobacter malorum]OAG75753.1 RND efflux system, outer membrane lipoprotein, NodT family [Acetobacter malorum]